MKFCVITGNDVKNTLTCNQFLRGSSKRNSIDIIKQLGYIQIDTLAVVARAHHHVIWSRNPNYKESELNKLMQQKQIFEYWSHAASYLPIEDFRFSLPRKQLYRDGHHHWFAKNKRIMKYVLDRIEAEGPLQSKDFETDRKRGSWFDWKPAKIALEQLFMEGSLMITERKGFQKVYDITERVLPSHVIPAMPSESEYVNYLIENASRSLGIFSLKDVIHLRQGLQRAVQITLQEMCEAGKLIEIRFPHSKNVYYAAPQTVKRKLKPADSRVHLLSPFDNLLIRRERLKEHFNFNYTLECYLPESKRKFGYFSLPILYGNEFVGTLDPKADRATGIFTVKSLHLHKPSDEFLQDLAKELMRFASFNSCEEFDLSGIKNRNQRTRLNSLLRNRK
jgi:uncharacterized protein YcaQ